VLLPGLGSAQRRWRKLELIRAGVVAATAQMPALTAAYEDCTDKIGPPPRPPANADTQAMLDTMRPSQQADSSSMPRPQFNLA